MTKNKEGIKATLSKELSEEYFHYALCNGLSEFWHYDLELSYDELAYSRAKESLQESLEFKDETICYEDVLMEILRMGGSLTVKGNGQDCSILLDDVHNRVQKTMWRHLNDVINEQGDATTADVILQTVFFKEIMFG